MKMITNQQEELEKELISLTDNLLQTKNTILLSDFSILIDKTLKDGSIDCKNTIIVCLNRLKKLIPSKCLKNLIDKAIQLKDVEICNAYLDNVQFVSENDAIKILKLFIEMEIREEETAKIINTRLEKKITKLFSIDYDYAFLAKELQKLSSKEFIICLHYLRFSLKSYFRNENSPLNTTNNSRNGSQNPIEEDLQQETITPNISQIINLLNCLIDAHFTHITLSNESQEIIADLLQIVESQVDIFSDLIAIESLLKETQKARSHVSKKNESGSYYIEVLKI